MKLRSALLVGLLAALAGFVAVPMAGATDGKPPPTTTSGTPWEELFSIKNPPRTLTVDEIRRMTERARGNPVPAISQAIVIATDLTDVGWQDLERLLAGGSVPGVRLVRTVPNPSPATTVGGLSNGDPPTQASTWEVKIEVKIVIKCKGDDCGPPPT